MVEWREFLLEKKLGKTTGWIGLYPSGTERQFVNLNLGDRFMPVTTAVTI
jgi:hypothetical protein